MNTTKQLRRIYRAVRSSDAGDKPKVRLVRAGNQAQALRHVNEYEVSIPSSDELVADVQAGVQVEDADIEPAGS